ncbi:Phage gp6-like head-tail connector protein [Pseudovibrio sp. W64]|uniref:head-tail connector protein n=1 Tax=Pseudovibrio sp. W64 TaxID=1735583 RepID=UPI0007B30CB1|nr:head-tail connector protein [Pseudovibrio sp. W64]KZK76487.1 Phage gp6-like head-tail connector protein [Pseudovibrio sp. W64]
MDCGSTPRLKTAPVTLPISVADIKLHLCVDVVEDDALIETYLRAAVSRLEGYHGELKRCLINQTWEQSYCCWPGNRTFKLWFPDVSRTEVTYVDASGVSKQLAPSLLEFESSVEGTDLHVAKSFSFPQLNADKRRPINITYVTGFGDQPEDIPAAINAAIMMMVGHLYATREDVVIGSVATSVPHSSKFMLEPYRRFIG